MFAGLALTGIVAFGISGNPSLYKAIFSSAFSLIFLVILQFGLVIYLSSRINHMTSTAAIVAFGAYAVVTGVMFSGIFLLYTTATISKAFFSTAIMFGGMSLYGMTTKKNLNAIGSYMIMGLWGLIGASVINLIFHSTALDWMISFIGVFLFLGLTAWDTQRIVKLGRETQDRIDSESYIKLSIIGALQLYLDFINLFLFLLRFFGRSSN